MSEQAETRDVCCAGCSGCDGDRCRIGVEACHGLHRRLNDVGRGISGLDGSGDHANPQWLCEDQGISGSETRVGEHSVGMDLSHDGQAELGFRVINGVSTGNHEAGL